jgi:ABC-2 type transport system permease protein
MGVKVMNNTLKVAKWEIKRNLRNKAFIASILITPILMLIFGLVPTFLAKFEAEKPFKLYVVDEIGVFTSQQPPGTEQVQFILTQDSKEVLTQKTAGKKEEGFIFLDQKTLESGALTIFTDYEGQGRLVPVNQILQELIYNFKINELGLTSAQREYLDQSYSVTTTPITPTGEERTGPALYIPAIFAGILYLAAFTAGTMTFQSALQEKKDKMVELLLSSVKANDLMQGKILGYFVLGLIQVGVWLIVGTLVAEYLLKIPVLESLFVPALIPMLFFALAGYLLYSALFVAIGATMEDAQSGSSFQGMIFIIPMLPLFVIGPIISNPSGTVALIGTFFPFTTPGVMLARLSISQQIPLWEILLSAAILILTIILVMKLAGKLFRTALLMYGKNASLAEVIKWLRY